MRLCNWLIIGLLTTASAQDLVTETAQVVQAVESAQREVLLVAPALFSGEVALALAQAEHFRNVEVFALLGDVAISAGGSYGPYLSLYGPVRVMSVERTFLVVDRTTLVEGPRAAAKGTDFDAEETWAVQGDVARARVRDFNALWAQAEPFELDDAYLKQLLEAP